MTGFRAASLLAASAPLAIVGVGLAPLAAFAQEQQRYNFHVSAGSLAAALRAISTTSGRSIAGPADLLAGKNAPALDGSYTVDAALDLLLAGSGLRARPIGDGLIIEADPRGRAEASAAPADDIVITGSRIRGAKVASPVITVTRDNARNQGQGTLGEIARSLPQSFGGGQNPGIGFNVPIASGSDVNGGSSINLRGLGSDATLTLLNGHRLAYSGSRQSVDVSTIPLGVLDRIEVVADGASAIYGSDAVGGVANIILRRDMSGVETQARIGGSTDGGGFNQQYGITAGARWQGGGFIAAYEFNRTTAIDWNDRDYAINRSIGLRLMPSSRNSNFLASLHQSFGGGFEFSLLGLYNRRNVLLIYPFDASGNLLISKASAPSDDKAWAIAPTLSWSFGDRIHVELAGSYAKDRVDYSVSMITPTVTTRLVTGCYCNRTVSIELSGDGRLFDLPGGAAKLALGVGYRRSGLESFSGAGSYRNFNKTLSSNYAYGELDLPLLGAASSGAKLDLNGAVRYERYRDQGSVATPKFGMIFGPVPWLDLKASWGRSFRAPTLLQRFQPNLATLYPVTSLGGTGYRAGSTALYITGGSATLRPERASSWSLTADLHPAAVKGLSFQVSYFSTNYVDRIVAPITFSAQSLSNPLYTAYVTRGPAQATIAGIIANAGLFQKVQGAVYDPATVVALVNNDNINAGRQRVHGIDLFLDYATDVGPRDKLTLGANANYLVSSRQLAPGQPTVQLAGVLFNPPHWRGRGNLGWTHDGFTLTSTLSYVGPLADTRSTPARKVNDRATLDVALRYRTPATAPMALRGLDIVLSVQNLFNTAPPSIATNLVTDSPYDSTNYTPVDRFVSLSIMKKW